jgi:hypothetical protein
VAVMLLGAMGMNSKGGEVKDSENKIFVLSV